MKTLKYIYALSSPFLHSTVGINGVRVFSLSSLSSISQDGRRECTSLRSFSSQEDTAFDYERDRPYDDVKNIEKDAALHLALSRLAGDFGKDSMLSLEHFSRSRYAPVISTGSLKLDLALGIGGLPKGRIVEIYGKEASGKTTLALHIVKEAQKLGGYCVYFDVENAMDPSLADAVGVDTENLLIARTNSAENSLSAVDTLIKSGSIDVIVVDSVAALVPQCELDGAIGESRVDVHSRLMAQALRKIHYSLCRSQTVLVLVNQIRSNVRSSQGFGLASEVTCGGNALRFHAAVRMRIMKRGLLGTEEEINGIGISVQVVKNKLAPAMKKAELDIVFGKGIFREAEVLEMASKHGVISKEGNDYYIGGQVFKDKMQAQQYLEENEGILDELVMILRTQLFKTRS